MRRTEPLDAAFFGLEAPGHPLHAMAVMMLDPATVPGGYSFGQLRRFIASRLPGIPPLRQRLVPSPLSLARPGWVDSQVDIRQHVFRHLRTGGSMADVASFAAGMASIPLDRTKPLWAMHVVEGLQDGRIAVVAKVHHSLMDGVAGMEFMASMFSLRPHAGRVVAVDAGATHAPGPVVTTALAVPELVTMPVRTARAMGATVQAARRLRKAAGQAPLRLPRPPRIRWNGELGPQRTMAMASLPLAEVKDLGRATGCTVNDVVMSVIGGACRSYLLAHGELPTSSLVAVVPVSTHDTDGRAHVANSVSIMLSTLGTDLDDPAQRLFVVHEAMVEAKRLHDALGAATLAQWLAVPSPLVMAAVARAYLGTHLYRYAPRAGNVLVSNVPGPPVPLYFGGARLVGLYPLGPVYDGVG
ncbi:MAG TPA: wax ester/triacylglycerol synthase family O-acyltransferase, partial [Acidimicrobiales bacterium]|nr:wax ester/triacylglycerol synthase family O-acyltransferase [Acidimicrobiales bacterium]